MCLEEGIAEMTLTRQCAWCLCLMDNEGERISQQPLPKLYNATHGMCCVCGVLWLEQMARDMGLDMFDLWATDDRETPAHLPVVEAVGVHARQRAIKMLGR